jgi:pimeloyl-ACP methyl ester carboxylesterase
MGDDVGDEVDGWAGRAGRVTVAGEHVAVVDVAPDRAGGAPPLLVVHGFPTSSIDFVPVLGRLAAGRRVVLVDLPGYGLSDKPDRPYSLFGQADVVEAVARDRDLSEVDLLTHDMGDSVGGELLARTLAGESPLRVRRRVLTNGSIYLDLAQLTDGQTFLRSLPDEMLPDGAGPDAEALAATLAALCAPAPPPAEAARHLRAGAELVVRAGGARLLPRLIRYLDERARHEHRWTGAVESHPAPLAVVWGRGDPIAVPAMVDRLVSRRPDAAVTWLEAGHWPMIEQPGPFADAALALLDA